MNWRNAYPESRGITYKKLWSSIRAARAAKEYTKRAERLAALSVHNPSEKTISTFAAPGISSLMSDPRGLIIANNCGFTLMTGYGPDDVRGRNCKLLQNPDDTRNTDANKKMRKAFQQRAPVVVMLFNHTKRGHEFCTLVDIRPIWSGDQFVGYYSLQVCLDSNTIPRQLAPPEADTGIHLQNAENVTHTLYKDRMASTGA